MTWTDGTDRATGDIVTATDWNALLGASGSLMNLKSHALERHSAVPYCRVRNSASQSIPNATDTAITFDTEVNDPNAMHSTSVNTSRINIATTGWYRVTGAVGFAQHANGVRQVYIKVTGTGSTSGAVADETRDGSNAIVQDMQCGTEVYLTAGQYVELWVYQDCTAAINSQSNGLLTPQLVVTWLSAA